MQSNFDEFSSEHPNGLITFNDVISLFIRWKNKLIILGIAAIVVSAIISFILTPKYKSTVIFYPTTNNSISNALLTDLNQRQKDVLEFGAEEEAEKALQILQSSKLTEKLVRNFDLMNHYKIDKNSNMKYYNLQLKINSNISYSRTRYLSIKIDVLDEDPKKAAEIANGISNLYDTVKNEIQQEVAIPALAIMKRALDGKVAEIDRIKDELRKLGTEGITNYEEQSRALSEEIYKVRAKGDMSKLTDLLDQQKTLVQFGGQFSSLEETRKLETERESILRAKYEKAEIDVRERLNNKFIVSAADVAEIRAYPLRKLIVLGSLIITLLTSAIFFAIYEKIKSSKKIIANA